MLLAVGDPDVFYLVGVLEVPAAFGVARVEEIEFAAFVGPDLLEIADGEQLGGGAESGVAVAPDGVEVIVFGENFEEFGGAAGNDVQGAAGEIAGFEDLIDVCGDERIGFGRNGDDGVSGGEKRKDESEVRADDFHENVLRDCGRHLVAARSVRFARFAPRENPWILP